MPVSGDSEQRLAPPRAAAIAGVLFSVLMGTCLIIVRLAIPARQGDAGIWLDDPFRRNAVRVAVQLAPFAGIAFLWFIGVLRNRIGALEDQFFATVFLGSGLLFVASLFASAGLSGALVEAAATGHLRSVNADTYYLVRLLTGSFLNVFAVKMAGVFIITTSTIVLRTGILPRWLALFGYGCAFILISVITNWQWIALLFPLWMLVLSVRILFAEFGSSPINAPAEAVR